MVSLQALLSVGLLLVANSRAYGKLSTSVLHSARPLTIHVIVNINIVMLLLAFFEYEVFDIGVITLHFRYHYTNEIPISFDLKHITMTAKYTFTGLVVIYQQTISDRKVRF